VNRSIVLLACAVAALGFGLLQPPRIEARPSLAPHQQPSRIVHINPVLDTYVGQGDDSKVGTALHLVAGAKNNAEYLALIRFDFPDYMVPGTQIVSATLHLFCVDTEEYDPSNRTFEVRLLASANWNNDTIYRNKPGATGSPVAWLMSPCDNQWVASPEVTNSVQKWFSGDVTNGGFQVGPRQTQGTTLFRFMSREGGGQKWPAGKQPDLTVEVILPPTPSPTDTDTPSPTITPTPSDTPTPSITPTPSDTPTPSNTPNATDTPTPTATPVPPPSIYLPFTVRTGGAPPEPTSEATVEPSSDTTMEPTSEATMEPTSDTTVEPTSEATVEPTSEPAPTEEPPLRRLLSFLSRRR
jgi:hypothetical protein